MKTCNAPYYCNFKTQCGTYMGCSYSSYCDYQCPRDSRWQNNNKFYCMCGGVANTNGRCSVCGLRKY